HMPSNAWTRPTAEAAALIPFSLATRTCARRTMVSCAPITRNGDGSWAAPRTIRIGASRTHWARAAYKRERLMSEREKIWDLVAQSCMHLDSEQYDSYLELLD